jgi:hypothetical protein
LVLGVIFAAAPWRTQALGTAERFIRLGTEGDARGGSVKLSLFG